MTRQPQTPVVLRARVAMLLLAAMTTLAAAGNHANADGGRLLRTVKSGDWRVSIFAAPDPPRVGLVDVGVLLQNDSTGAVVSNAEIIVTLRTIEPLDGTPVAESAAATPDQSTNKLLQSALLELPRAGDWQGAIDVAADGRTASIPFELTVALLRLGIATLLIVSALVVAHKLIAVGERTLSSVLPGITITLALWLLGGLDSATIWTGSRRPTRPPMAASPLR